MKVFDLIEDIYFKSNGQKNTYVNSKKRKALGVVEKDFAEK